MIKTCLVLSDDPDDHQILYDAISEISTDIALVILADPNHLQRMVDQRVLVPDYIVFDPDLLDGYSDQLSSVSKNNTDIKLIAYSEDNVQNAKSIPVSKRLPYSQLLSRLREIFTRD